MKQQFASPLGYNDEQQSLFLSYESPTSYQTASPALKLRFRACFIYQFKRAVQFMDRYGISWEYREHNMLVSHRQYISKDKLVQGPLLIFIDFVSWYLLNDNFVYLK